jgi:O-antigen/teichoic acid export membrane protein
MDNRYKYLFKNTTILTIGQFSSKILSFFLVPLYTSVLSTKEYGSYDLAATSVSLLIPILTLNISDGLMRFAMDKDKNIEDVKSVAIKYELIGCLPASIIVLIFYLLNLFPDYHQYYFYILLFFISSSFYQFGIQLAKGEEKVKEIAIAGVFSTIITVVLNILLLLVLKFGLQGFYVTSIIGQLIPALYLLYITGAFKSFCIIIDKRLQSEMLSYSIPAIMISIGWWANSASDRYFVTWMCGVETNGIYAISYKIPTIITSIQNIVIQAWQISAIKEFQEKNYQKFYGNSFFHLNAVIVGACSVLLLFTKVMARILYAKEFYQAWIYVPFLLISSVFNASAGFLGPILSAKKDTKTMAISSIYGTISNVILNFVLIYLMRAQGAAIATAISSAVIYYFRERKIRDDIEYSGIKQIIFSWVIVIIQAILIICKINMFFQIPFVAIIMFIYRKEVIKILQLLRKALIRHAKN